MRLNLGCGNKKVPGFTGVDLCDGADIQCDIRELSFAPDNSVEEILAVHVIEHFYKWEIQPLLTEWRRVLVPGGKIALECPNLERCALLFLSGATDQFGMWGFYGNPDLKDVLHCHHWGYTPKSLAFELQLAGFKEIKPLPAQWKVKDRDMRVEAIK